MFYSDEGPRRSFILRRVHSISMSDLSTQLEAPIGAIISVLNSS